jgi:microcystin-dependent protein
MKRQDFINILLLILIVSFIIILSSIFLKKKEEKHLTFTTSTTVTQPISNNYENLLTTYNPDNAVSVLYTDEDADMNNTIIIAPGTIVMWSNGTIAPDGWALCNGFNGTPDLTDCFIKAGNLINSSQSPKTKDKGGSDNIVLDINNIPNHQHNATAEVSYSGSHSHTGKTNPYNHSHNYNIANQTDLMDSADDHDQVWNNTDISDNADTSEVDNHIHNFNNTTEKNDHIHQVNIKVDSVGYSVPININPLHRKLNFIMKLEGRPDDYITEDEKNVLHTDREGNIKSTVLVYRGMIVMWNGNNIPYGWALCDGKTNDTPNLIDMFVKSTLNEDYNIGGLRYIKIEDSNLPPHTHDAICYLEESGKHSHTVQDNPSGKHSHRYNNKYNSSRKGDAEDFLASATDILRYTKISQTSEDSHTHDFTTNLNGSHSHFINNYNMENSIGGEEINTDPQYYVLCYIMKI